MGYFKYIESLIPVLDGWNRHHHGGSLWWSRDVPGGWLDVDVTQYPAFAWEVRLGNEGALVASGTADSLGAAVNACEEAHAEFRA